VFLFACYADASVPRSCKLIQALYQPPTFASMFHSVPAHVGFDVEIKYPTELQHQCVYSTSTLHLCRVGFALFCRIHVVIIVLPQALTDVATIRDQQLPGCHSKVTKSHPCKAPALVCVCECYVSASAGLCSRTLAEGGCFSLVFTQKYALPYISSRPGMCTGKVGLSCAATGTLSVVLLYRHVSCCLDVM
jgi:hypothetical protein